MADEDEKSPFELVFYQPIQAADIELIEGKKTPELVALLLRELAVIGLGLDELSERMAKEKKWQTKN